MKKVILLISMTVSAFFASAQFTPNNIVVAIAGDGSTPSGNGAQAMFLQEIFICSNVHNSNFNLR